MSRSFLKQDTQINSSYNYDDTLQPGATLQDSGSNLEFDLNALRSQTNRILASGSGNWFDDLPTVNGLDGAKQRGLLEIATELDDLETKRILCPVQVLTDVPVLTNNNFVVLSASLSQAPSDTIASGTGVGTVVAELSGDVGSHSLELISGSNVLTPINLLKIRDAATKNALTVSGSEVWGLLQVENGGLVQGDAFNDTDRQAQISFVYVPSGSDQYAPVWGDIMGGQVIEYLYNKRIAFENIPEDCNFPGLHFIDQGIGTTTVDLNTAIDNQIGPVTQDQDIDVDISNSFAWAFRSGTTDMWKVQNDINGGFVEINANSYDNNATTNDFANGATFDSTGQGLEVGVQAGTINSTAGNDLTLSASNEMFFDDGNQEGSTWAQTGGIKLSESTAEWDTFETLFGEVSILSAIISGSNATGHTKGYAVATTNINAGTNASTLTNLSGSLPDYSNINFQDDVNVYVNGQLLFNGGDNDVQEGIDQTIGDLIFNFRLRGTGNNRDIVTLEVFK